MYFSHVDRMLVIKRYSLLFRFPELDLTIRCSLMSYTGHTFLVMMVGVTIFVEDTIDGQMNYRLGLVWFGFFV